VVAIIIAPWLRRGSLWAFGAAAVAWLITVACGSIVFSPLNDDIPQWAQRVAYAIGLGTQFIVFMFIGVRSISLSRIAADRRDAGAVAGPAAGFFSRCFSSERSGRCPTG